MGLGIAEDAGQRPDNYLTQEVSEKSAGSNFLLVCH